MPTKGVTQWGVSDMRRSVTAVLALIATLMLAGTAVAAPVGTTTINLRTWQGATAIDDVRVCLARGGQQVVCGETEDGELWADSLPAGAYRAWVEPTGYELAGITCTTFPDVPYRSCRPRGSEVRFVVGKEVVAVNINFLLSAA
jgi:hypothetical protein